jgi:macrolide transport system ATP-binding/permease protein
VLIELTAISKSYATRETELSVLRDVSLQIAQGEFVALMGSSGSGKTTLMNLMGCLDVPSAGRYVFAGQDVARLTVDERADLRCRSIGFVFQTFNLLPRTNALHNVLLPSGYSSERLTNTEASARATALLARVGLAERLLHDPAQLSGGQQQRVAIARALINRPILILADEPTGNLDSTTSAEVLELFRELNEVDGVTVVLVTHEEEVARQAQRIVRLHDGRIVADAPNPEQPQRTLSVLPAASAPNPARVGSVGSRFALLFGTAIGGLRRNLLRAALTTLGIVIGIAAVIAMMELGRGSALAIQKTIASMGANNLLVFPGTAASGGVSFGAGSVMTLTPEDGSAIIAEAPNVRAAAPVVRARSQVIYGDRNWVPISIIGTSSEYLRVRDWALTEGEPFSERDVRNSNKVCLIGQRLVRELFAGQQPVGQIVRIQNVPFTVVGVLAVKGANMMGIDQDDILLAPWTAIKFRVSAVSNTSQTTTAQATSTPGPGSSAIGTRNLYPIRPEGQGMNTAPLVRFVNVDQIIAAAHDSAAVAPAVQEITEILRRRHRIRGGEQDDFSVRDMAEMTRIVSSTSALMTKLLLAVSLISLLVGGVGIMNIMLVSVIERTREVGLRMAVGARRRDILQQFLLESVLLCLCGGIVGILLGRGISTAIRVFLRWPIEVSLDAILIACAVSVTVGIAFGFYPAWKAARQDPIAALRYE